MLSDSLPFSRYAAHETTGCAVHTGASSPLSPRTTETKTPYEPLVVACDKDLKR